MSCSLTFWAPKILSGTTGLLGTQKPHTCCKHSCAHHNRPKNKKLELKIISHMKLSNHKLQKVINYHDMHAQSTYHFLVCRLRNRMTK